jgi:sugar/nucleoside kinase (ribokinase family)
MADPIGAAAERAAALAREGGAKVSIDLSSANLIREFGHDRLAERVARIRPDAVFGNEAEHEELSVDSEVRIVKRGAEGASIAGRSLAVHPGEVVDTTGAGDALAAGYLVGGPELAMEAAARCVARIGSMP